LYRVLEAITVSAKMVISVAHNSKGSRSITCV